MRHTYTETETHAHTPMNSHCLITCCGVALFKEREVCISYMAKYLQHRERERERVCAVQHGKKKSVFVLLDVYLYIMFA